MPIPTPKSGQSQDDYMSVCMSFLKKEGSKYPEQKQKVAICLSTYRKKNESDYDIVKRLETMINDTTCTGDVALPQGQVMGMQYRKKKKKIKGGASYDVHESDKGTSYGEERGKTNKVRGHYHDYFFDRMSGDGGTGVAKGQVSNMHMHKIKAMAVMISDGHDHDLK